MLTTLNTAYTDTRADDLAWALGREPLPALAALDLELAGAKLQLRLLGASHQVLLEEEQGSCSETVACIPGSSTRCRSASPSASATGSTNSRHTSRPSPRARSRAAHRNSSRWCPTTPTDSPGCSPAARTPSPRCSPTGRTVRCAGAPGTPIRRRVNSSSPGPGWACGPRPRCCDAMGRHAYANGPISTRVGDWAELRGDVAFAT